MLDQNQFMEALLALADYALYNGNVLTKAEVDESFAGMELSKEQYDMIYRYLFEKKITIQGIRIEPAGEGADTKKVWKGSDSREEKDGEGTDSHYINVYLKEIAPYKISVGEQQALAVRLLAGEEEVLDTLLHASLHEVVGIAKAYRGKGVHVEDLVQEGNIALMEVLRELTGRGRMEEPLAYIHEYVRCAVAAYIDEQSAYGEAQQRIVAKLGLLHEAAKHMAKENGVLPDPQELADFTKLSVEEVKELVKLSKDVDFFGKDL